MDLSHVTVEVEHRFAAPPAEVFALLSDVERMAGLGPEHHTARWTDGSRTRFAGFNRMGDFAWEVACVVIADEPPTRFSWTVGDPDHPSSTWAYDLTADGDGTTVRQTFAHGPGMTYLRHLSEKDPANAPHIIEMRSHQLRGNMRTVLEAADALLSPGAPAPAAEPGP